MGGQFSMPGVGDLVGERYRIERPLSKGGMGSVFVAVHTQTQRRFALKLMSTELAGDDQAEARFMREARLAGAIDHPTIIEIYDVGHHEGFPYMVMKLLEGESLGERLKRGPIPAPEAMALLLPILDGVTAAHAEGIVHRDLKPDNIYLWAAAPGHVEPKVLDFGISKLVDGGKQTQKLTQTGMAVGTPLYMSPEQIRGERDVDARSDVYSLGVILYEMLTGQVPYTGRTYADLVLNVITGGAAPPSQTSPAVPSKFDEVVACAIAVDRDARYADVASLATDLRAIDVGERPIIAPRISRVSAVAAPTPFATETSAIDMPVPGRVSPMPYIALGAGALVAAAAAAWLLSSEPAPTPTTAAPVVEGIEAVPPTEPATSPQAIEPSAPSAEEADDTQPKTAQTASPANQDGTASDARGDREAREHRQRRSEQRRSANTQLAPPPNAPAKIPSDRTPVIRMKPREDSPARPTLQPVRVPALERPPTRPDTPMGSEELIDPFK